MKLALVGDICLGEHYFSFGHGVSTFAKSGNDIFYGVRDILKCSDLILGNLECVVTSENYNKKSPKERVFRGCEEALNSFNGLPITILNIANNHCLEHGLNSYNETVKLCESFGITLSGNELNEGVASVTINGKKVVVLGASLINDDKFNSNETSYSYLSEETIVKRLRKLSIDSDLLILNIHWGLESSLSALEHQKKWGKLFLEAGADVILGHHPHIFYEIERIDGKLLCYSLGDFVFDLTWNKFLRKSGIVLLEFDDDVNLINVIVQGVDINKSGLPKVSNKELILNRDGMFDFYNFKKNAPNFYVGKFFYFAKNFFLGDSMIKFRFLIWKVKEKLLK